MAQGIDGHVDLAALLACLRRRALVAMVTGLHTALTTGWQRSPIQNGGTRLYFKETLNKLIPFTPFDLSQDRLVEGFLKPIGIGSQIQQLHRSLLPLET